MQTHDRSSGQKSRRGPASHLLMESRPWRVLGRIRLAANRHWHPISEKRAPKGNQHDLKSKGEPYLEENEKWLGGPDALIPATQNPSQAHPVPAASRRTSRDRD